MPHAEACSVGRRGPAGGDVAVVAAAAASFFYIYFSKTFLQKYIFNFTIYSFIPLPPGRRAAGGRNLYVKKIYAEALGGSLPP